MIEKLVDIEGQPLRLQEKELHEQGDRIEAGILSGQETFLVESDRTWLRGLFEGAEINLTNIEGKADLSGQADQLVLALGCENLAPLVAAMIVEIVENPGGEVFKGESEKPENAKDEVRDFVTEYLERQLERGEFVFDPLFFKKPDESWKKNTVYRIEAVMSVMNKLFWILQADNETESVRRQNTPGVLKHLRERVMRGAEKAGETIDHSVKRTEDKIIRYLPPKSIGVILEHLTTV